VEENSIKDNLHCCGCRACEQICPKQAISMSNDNEGFLKACVNTSKCINCGLCKKICPAESRKNLFPKAKKMFAAIHKQDAVVRRSSSGGMFSAFAHYILENKGSVYGCKLDENLKPIQCRVEDEEKLDALRRSKYVQSDTEHTYTQVKQDLSKGKMVLYAGTPCQIAGLRGFLVKPYD
jgi:coenzyme F420-reducing hydrogenase beta subunit